MLEAVLVLSLIAALALGPAAIGSASGFGAESLPCQMQMDALDHQPSPDELPDPSHQKVPLACPMMVGGSCIMMFAVAPAPASLPAHADPDVKAIRLEESVSPHVVSPLRRPPRSL